MASSLFQIIFSFLFFLSNFFSPQIGFVLTFLSPVFLLNYLNHKDRTRKTDLISFGILGISILMSPLIPVYYILIVVVPTYIVVSVYKGRMKVNYVIVSALPLFIFSLFIIMIFKSYTQELINMIAMQLKSVTSNLSPDLLLSDKGSKLLYIKNNYKVISHMVVYLIPALSLAYTALIAFTVSRYYARKYKVKYIPYRTPEKLLIILILGGFLIIFKTAIFQLIAINTLIIFAALFFIQGFEVITLLFVKYKVSVFFKMILYVLIFSYPPVLLLVSLLGLSDNWLVFSKRINNEEAKK